MTGWLVPVRRSLEAGAPVGWFFRDDDGGWADSRLAELLARFERLGLPVDVAVIPAAADAALARRLEAYTEGLTCTVHQHGWAHQNHQRSGRRSEFGADRSLDAIAEDVERGSRRMRELFGHVEPFFTPPWNRCREETAAVLAERGFTVLSRDATARPILAGVIAELPVAVDWSRQWNSGGARHVGLALAAAVHDARRTGCPVGVMVHHAVMGAQELDTLTDLLAALRSDPQARIAPMRTHVLPTGTRVPARRT